MDTETTTSVVQETTDYNKFKLQEANRPIYEPHVRDLAQSIGQKPESLKYRPLLVNRKMEVIDGQHRLAAAKMLGVPVYYMVGNNLDIGDTQRLNATQRNWGPFDYARSYAVVGVQAYIDYLRLREEFGFGHNVIQAAINGGARHMKFAIQKFRQGQLKFVDGYEGTRERLQMLADILEFTPNPLDHSRVLHQSILSFMQHPEYSQQRMLSQMKGYGDLLLNRRLSKVEEYGQALEEIYNAKQPFERQVKFI